MDARNLDALRTKEYWENRYGNEPPEREFDWFKCYDDLAPWLTESLHHEDEILMLGCGNSVLTRDSKCVN
jgi:EEF1A lysine methyltransferase 4